MQFRTPYCTAKFVWILAACIPEPAQAQTRAEVMARDEVTYSVKPSEVRVPEDVPLGQYRRVTQPYGNWVLNCDENLKTMQRTCNISQSIMNSRGVRVFSWTLAATENGKPMLILRLPPDVGPGSRVSFAFPDRSNPLDVKIEECDATVCIALVPVGPLLKEQIHKMTTPVVSFTLGNEGPVRFEAPLKGLSAALGGIEGRAK